MTKMKGTEILICRRNQKGFTLIELMIVVVIIGILAALAVPRFMSTSGKAKKAEAKTILKQIYQLERVYYLEHDRYIGAPNTAALAATNLGFEDPGADARYDYSVLVAIAMMAGGGSVFIATATEISDADGDGIPNERLTMNQNGVEGGDWYYNRSSEDVFAKSFGFDLSGFQFISFGDFLATHSWEELHAIVRGEIDGGSPVYLRLQHADGGHSVVITGYRVEGGATEYYINFGHHGGYSLAESYRLEEPIGGWDLIEDRHVIVGIRPAANPARLPLWNKLDEVRDSEYYAWPSGCVIPTDDGFLCAYPVGPLDGHDLLLVRTDRFGRKIGESVIHHREGMDLYHPRLAFSSTHYGLAWMEGSPGGQAFLHFNILDEAGNMTLAEDVVIGELRPWHWRLPFSVEWTGTAFLIVWHAWPTGELRLTLLDTDGHYVGPASTLLVPGGDPDVVCFADKFAVAFSTWDAIWFATYDYSGRLLTGPHRLASGDGLYTPRVVYDGSSYAVVWEDNTLDSRRRVLLYRLSESGLPMTAEPLEVNSPSHEPVARCPSIAYVNGHYYISYTQKQAWCAQIDRDLQVVTRHNTSVSGWHWVHFVSMAQRNEHLLLVQAWLFWDELTAPMSVEFEACHLYTCPIFGDVPTTFWGWPDIEACYFAGIVGGYGDGLYHPEYAVTRDQMAVYISRALAGGEERVPEFAGTPTFPDVDEGFWALDHVEHAVEQNVVEGYDDGNYHPEYEVTRDQMAVYVARAMVAPTGEAALADYLPTDPRDFPDVPPDRWGWKHIEYCVEHDVVEGYEDGLYHPAEPVARDQMAVYIARAFQLPI